MKAKRARPTDPSGWIEPRIDQAAWEKGQYKGRALAKPPEFSSETARTLYEERMRKTLDEWEAERKSKARRGVEQRRHWREAKATVPLDQDREYAEQDAAEVEV